MNQEKPYVADIGTAIVLNVGPDLSDAISCSIEVIKPDLSTVSWPAQVEAATHIRYDSVEGTFDQPGIWKMQAKVVLPNGTWYGKTADMRVYRLYK